MRKFQWTVVLLFVKCLEAVPINQDILAASGAIDAGMYAGMSGDKSLRLIETGENERKWILESDKDVLRRLGIKYMDVTDSPSIEQASFRLCYGEANYPATVNNSEEVENAIASLRKDNLKSILEYVNPRG